jgi:hypothetical protein
VSKEVTIRPYTNGDEKEIVELLQTVFKGWPHFDLSCSPLDHWTWKYEDNPLKTKAIAVAELDGKIIGCSHGYLLNIRLGNKPILAQQGTDLAILEEFRGRGIYPTLTKKKNELYDALGVQMTYSISSNPIVVGRDQSENRPQFPCRFKHYVKLDDVAKHFETTSSKNPLKKHGYNVLKTIKKMENITQNSKKEAALSSFEILEKKPTDVEVDEFWNSVKDKFNFTVERDEKYLSWRYNDERGGKYLFRCAENKNGILGFIVLRVNKKQENYPVGYIVDMITQQNRIDIAYALIDDATNFFHQQGVNLVQSMVVEGHPYERLIENQGFLWDREPLIVFYRPKKIGEELKHIINSPPEKLQLSYGDFDWI